MGEMTSSIDNMVAQLVQCDKVTSTVRAEVFQRMAIESLLAHIIPTEDDLDEGLVMSRTMEE